MRVDANDINELIEKSHHKELMSRLDQWMQETFPSLTRYFIAGESITMIGYGPMSYYQSNELHDWPLIAIAPQKNNVSLYISALKDNEPLLSFYSQYFPKSTMGKTCLRLKNAQKIDFDLLEEIITSAEIWHKNKIKDIKL